MPPRPIPPLWRSLLWLWLALCAGPVLSGPDTVLTPQESRRWLERIHDAAHARNYQGILVFSADGALASSRVAHFCEGTQSFERVEALDGEPQLVYRHNDDVYSVWPQSRLAVIEKREPQQASLRRVIEPRIGEHYELIDQGVERIAGREAQVLLLRPRDKQRYAQRLWVDTRSGLMLRADVLGPHQRVLESSAFSEVEIDVQSRPQTVLQPIRYLDGYRQVRPQHIATQLEAQGWLLRPPVPGFSLSSCSLRSLNAGHVARGDAPTLQAVFSDGLTHVSLFIDRVGGTPPRRALSAQTGATHTLMQPLGSEWWITLMGDVPLGTLTQFVQALERRP